MDQSCTVRRLVLPIVGLATVAAIVVVFATFITPGYDTSYTLAWGRDLAHGLGLDFTHPSSPTPHPLAVLAGAGIGFLPVQWAINAAGGLSVVAWLSLLTLLGIITFDLTASRIAAGAAIICALVSAPLGLLALGASSDVPYCALGLGAVLLTLRGRYPAAIAVLLVAAMLRPEAVLLAVAPLTLAFLHKKDPDRRNESGRSGWIGTVWVFAIGLVLAIAAWLAVGALGGDLLIGLHSAKTNAEFNNNPRGPIVALTQALPGLAGPTGWLTFWAAAIALIAVLMAGLTRAPAGRATRNRTHKPGTAGAAIRARRRSTTVVASFIGVALIAYFALGFIGTPLVARYLLLPALLCIALATLCIPLANRLVRTTWAPAVVRSPAIVALTALALDRPLRDITVADHAGAGVLLQPLTRESMELAGYGPMTSLAVQSKFPTDAPPRQSNLDWALYSRCQP